MYGINDWNPWLVVHSCNVIEHSPTVALELNKILFRFKSFALEFFNPFSVIVLLLKSTYLLLPISLGVNHCILPFQYSDLFVSGVPPPTTFAISLIYFPFQSPLNSGNLNLGQLSLSPLLEDTFYKK